jgi:hypothetical protein
MRMKFKHLHFRIQLSSSNLLVGVLNLLKAIIIIRMRSKRLFLDRYCMTIR